MSDHSEQEDPPRAFEPEFTRGEVRRRASAGLFVRSSSGFVTLAIGFAGNLVLARLLTPEVFGIVAIGATVTLIASSIADGGLASGLIRRPEPPTRSELRTLSGIQFAFTVPFVGLVAFVASFFGTAGSVAALMLLSVPLAGFQTPGRVILNRRLLYSRVALVDLAASVTFYVWAIVGVTLGHGVWAIATATVARAAVMSVAFAFGSSMGFVVPTLRGARQLGDLVRFGARFQSAWLVAVARDQALYGLTAGISGFSTLGLWSLARRLVELPITVVDTVGLVAFPTMSHILGRNDDPRPLIEKAARYGAIGLAVLLSAFAASSVGLVPFAFGEQWRDAVWAIVPACLGIGLASSATVAAAYLFALGHPGHVVKIGVIGGLTWIGTSLVFVPLVGAAGLGIGWISCGLVDIVMYERAVRKHAGARILVRTLVPIACGAVGGGAGIAAALTQDMTLIQGVLGGTTAVAVTTVLLVITCRRDVIEVARTLHDTVRDAARVGLARGASGSPT